MVLSSFSKSSSFRSPTLSFNQDQSTSNKLSDGEEKRQISAELLSDLDIIFDSRFSFVQKEDQQISI